MYTLVDSNIVIYSLAENSPKKDVSQEFIRDYKEILCLSHQVILETLRVLTHPKFKNPMTSERALKSVWTIVNVLTLLSPNLETILTTKELIKKYEIGSNRIFDAYLVATALSNSVGIIATDNTKHFEIYDEVKILNPFANW